MMVWRFVIGFFCSMLLSDRVFSIEFLTVYVPPTFISEWGPGQQLQEAFQAVYPECKLRFVTFSNGSALVNQLVKDPMRHRADVVLGLDATDLSLARKKDLFIPHGIFCGDLQLPGGWNDPHFLPYCYAHLGIMYRSHGMCQPPITFDALVHDHSDWRILYPDPRTSSIGFGFLLWIHSCYPKGTDLIWKALNKKTVTVPKSWCEAYGLFLKGESDGIVTYSTSYLYHQLIEKSFDYAFAVFEEGHPLQIEVAGILANAISREWAKKLLVFILSVPFQSTLPLMYWMHPVIHVPLPSGYEGAKSIPFRHQLSQDCIALNRERWLTEWKQAR